MHRQNNFKTRTFQLEITRNVAHLVNKIIRKDPQDAYAKNPGPIPINGCSIQPKSLLKLRLLFVCLIQIGCLFAQKKNVTAFDPQKKFTVHQLQSDLNLLKLALEKTHPGLYTYNTKEQFEHRFDSIYKSIDKERTELQFFSPVSSLLASIGCGHTVGFLSKDYKKEIGEKTCRYFPFKVKVLGNRIYIFDNQSTDTTVAPGWEILELNGKSGVDVLNQIMPFIGSDGYNLSLKPHEVANKFMFDYAEFIEQPLWFRIKLKAPNDELVRFVTLPALSLDEMKRIRERRQRRVETPSPKTRPLQFQVTDEKVAILTISSFDKDDLAHCKQHFHRFIRHAFNSIKQTGVTDLIIDLRNNGGGDDNNGWFLYSFLTDSSFRYYDRVEVADNEKLSFLRHTNKPMLFWFFRRLVHKNEGASGRYLWKHGRYTRIHKPSANNFSGPVFILINGGCFSATTEFAAIAEHNKRAYFVGEETGGAYQGDNSGLEMILTLPNTHIRIRIPMMKYVSAVDNEHARGRGIMPIYKIMPTIEDLIQGKDPEKEFTLDLIQRKNCKACGR